MPLTYFPVEGHWAGTTGREKITGKAVIQIVSSATGRIVPASSLATPVGILINQVECQIVDVDNPDSVDPTQRLGELQLLGGGQIELPALTDDVDMESLFYKFTVSHLKFDGKASPVRIGPITFPAQTSSATLDLVEVTPASDTVDSVVENYEVADIGGLQDALDAKASASTLPADYTITKSGSTYTATPRNPLFSTYSGTNFTTVLQGAVDALTPAGAQGSGGGKIHITKGTYTFGNEVVVTGWEGITGTSGIPQSSLIIEGEGLATKLVQNTSGQNAFVVKNLANVSFLDIFGSISASAKSFIFGDKTGAQSEMSFWGGTIRVNVFSASTTAAPIYLKNFFDLDVPKLWVYASAYHAMILETDSSAVHYGNSHFGHIRAVGSSSSPFAGVVLRSTNGTYTMNLNSFENLEVGGAYYGFYGKSASENTFTLVDIEGVTEGMFFDTGASDYPSRDNSVLGGKILPNAGGVGIRNAAFTGGNKFHVYVDTSPGTITAAIDLNTGNQPNEYDLGVFLDADATAAAAASAPHHNRLRIEAVQGFFYDNLNGLHALPAKTTPVDADEWAFGDSASNYRGSRFTFANLKTYLRSAFVSRRLTTVTQSATPAINTDTTDIASITGLAQAITSMSSGLTGTPSAGDQLVVEITDNGTGRAIVWGAKFEGDLPVLTANGVKLTVVFRWNPVTSAWRAIAVSGGSLYASTYVRVTMSGSPAQTTAVTTWEKLQFNTESSDLGGNFNNTSGGTNPWGYTTPAAGVYLATLSARLTDSSTLDTGMGLDISAGSVTGDVWSPVKTSANGTRFSMNATRMFRVTGAGTAIYGCVFGDTALSVKDAEMTIVKVA